MIKLSGKILLILILMISCSTKNEQDNQFFATVDGLLGNEVKITKPGLIYNKDNYNPFKQTEYKIVLYTDSADCVDCLFKLDSWNDVIKDFDNNFKDRVSFIFYFHSAAQEQIENLLIQENFRHPIFIDKTNEFYMYPPYQVHLF